MGGGEYIRKERKFPRESSNNRDHLAQSREKRILKEKHCIYMFFFLFVNKKVGRNGYNSLQPRSVAIMV